ncbi:MAG: GNAT family N-acetyltransferase [Candidatus Eremiobacteraeota bacterium]|nr:GNAT family N-acetyltransferase [Candidatus Eremiobacteraeota bacterium]
MSETHRMRDGSSVTIEPMQTSDQADVAALLRSVPENDLLFVGFDIRDDSVIRSWTQSTDRQSVGAVARRDGTLLGFTVLSRDRAPWKRHVGSVLVVVAPAARGLGLGTLLVRKTILLAGELGLEKIAARMVVEDRDTVRVFEKLGFRQEGVLLDHAKASDGTLYDIAYMGLMVKKYRDAIEAAGNHIDLTRKKTTR